MAPASAFSPWEASATTAVAVGTFVVAAGFVASLTGEAGMTALVTGELMLLLTPVAVLLHRRRPWAVLGLARPRSRELLAAVLIGSSLWLINLKVVELLPVPDGSLHALQQAVEAPPLALAVLTIAIVPAIAEEVLFRGVLVRALATRVHAAAAIAIAATAFAAYHLSWLQLVPTFTLGLAMGLLVLRARSVVPAIVAHAINNAIAIVVARDELPAIPRAIGAHPTLALGCAAALTTVGVALLLPRPRLLAGAR